MVLNVTAVLAQMYRDPVRTAKLRLDRCPDRVRFIGLPCLAECGYVVDVDAEFYHGFKINRRMVVSPEASDDLPKKASLHHEDELPVYTLACRYFAYIFAIESLG
jgi:hypothetical protein